MRLGLPHLFVLALRSGGWAGGMDVTARGQVWFCMRQLWGKPARLRY